MATPPDSVFHAAPLPASSPPFTDATYLFSAAGVLGALSQIDPLAIIATALAVCTFFANQWWAWAKNRRDAKASALQLEIDRLRLAELQAKAEKATE